MRRTEARRIRWIGVFAMAAAHKNLHVIKAAFARSESEIVAVISIGDSRSDWRKWRLFGQIARCFDVKWAGLIVQGGVEANNGNEDGLGNFQTGSPAPNQGLAGIPYRPILSGSTGTNSTFVNRYPGAIAEVWVTGATSNPHFQRFNIVYSTAGFDMHSNAAGATGGQFYRGDPAQGRNVTSLESFFVTDNRTGIWLPGAHSFGFSASESSGGSATFTAPPAGAADGTITQFVLTPTPATGTNIRARQYHTTASPSVGTGHILAATRINFGTSGILFDEWNIGGFSTTDHLAQNPPGIGSTNTDWKYSDSKATEWYQKIVRSPVCILMLDCGQNQSTVSGYEGWNGTTTGNYKRDIRAIIDRDIAILQAAGVTDLYIYLKAPWRGASDTLARLAACRDDMSAIVDEVPVTGIVKGIALYDQIGALDDAGQTTSGELNTALREDTAHQNYPGMIALGQTEWAAIQAAVAPSSAAVSRTRVAVGIGVGF